MSAPVPFRVLSILRWQKAVYEDTAHRFTRRCSAGCSHCPSGQKKLHIPLKAGDSCTSEI